jgi:hypothetical protein
LDLVDCKKQPHFQRRGGYERTLQVHLQECLSLGYPVRKEVSTGY